MCGIVGVYQENGDPVSVALLQRMSEAIAHRGPDGEGTFVDGPVGFAHRRLAIIDLSDLGRQPMANETGDVTVTFNGEIYNFRELRVELQSLGHRFRSQTDTEVIVHAYEEWGENCVDHFKGMFAFGIWDRQCRRLFLARDRFGIKPLYWYHSDGVFLFASEIKAILRHPRVRRSICYPALDEYFTFQNVFSDLTLFQGVRMLPPATTLSVQGDGSARPHQRRYWDFPFSASPNRLDEQEATEEVRRLFQQAVKRQLRSDVPVGAYLSGGLDSGSIVGTASPQIDHLKTFTGGFDLQSASGLELSFDERRSARFLAELFQTEHHEMVMHAGDMEWILPGLVWHIEDLRVGQSFPNYYVARMASKYVKVVLSGIGGDELFGGYPWRYGHALRSTSREDYFQKYYALWERLIPANEKREFFSDEARRKIGDHSAFDAFRTVYQGFPGPLETPEERVNASLYFELKTFLHGLLVVEDKLSMAHSLESRVPFLDEDLVEFACRIPAQFKLRSLQGGATLDENLVVTRQRLEQKTSDGKQILRKAMDAILPTEVIERTKQGFSAPDASWFRGESIDYLRRLLCNRGARIYDFINPAYVGRILDEHCANQVNRRLLIWSILNLEWWLANFDTCPEDSQPFSRELRPEENPSTLSPRSATREPTVLTK